MSLFWGPEHIQFYNDAYLPSFGRGKHPEAMGQRAAECWAEIWPIIGPQIDAVMLEAKPSWHEDALVAIGDLRHRLGLHADELGLERGDQRGQLIRRHRASARIGSRARHESTYTDGDLVVQAEMHASISEVVDEMRAV